MSYTETVYDDRAAWLAARRETIGGSDAPVILGLSRWQSPAGLYAEKLGLLPPPEEQTEAQEMGLILEPIIRRLYEERTGQLVISPRPWLVRRSTKHPFMTYSPDGWVWRGDTRGVFQAKTTSAWHGREWDDEPPIHYLVQLQHEMAVEDVGWGVLAVLIGGQRFRHFEVERHERLIAGLVERERDFWTALQARTAPPVDGSAACSALLRELHPADNGGVVELPAEALEWDRAKREADEHIRRWQAQKDEAENKLRAAIGDNEVGMLPGTLASYSWKATTYKIKATEAREDVRRVLRRKEVK